MSNTSVAPTSPDPLIVTLNLIELNIGRYLYPVIFILGNIGSILNVLILTQRVYLQNSCSCYILASSVVNLLIINIVVFFRLLAYGFNIDPTTTSWFFCKFRTYIAHVTTLLSRYYIVLACADRWAMSSTSVKRRAFSQIKVAKILIPSLGISMCIISIHTILYDGIVKGRCIQTPLAYATFYNIYNTFLSGFLIPILMILFGFLTIRNIKRSRQRVNVQTNTNRLIVNQQIGRLNPKCREYDILIMVLVQLGVYLITCLPFAMYSLYSSVTIYWAKTSVQTALDNFYSSLAYTLLYINFSATFYIYLLTTRIFRKEVKLLILKSYLFKICFGLPPAPTAMGTGNDHPIRAVAIEMKQRAIINI